MSRLQKLKTTHFLKWASLVFSEINVSSSKSNLYADSYYTTQAAINLKNGGALARKSRVVRKQAQAALVEYFHSTRSLKIMDAENMSKNAPEFFDKLLDRMDIDSAKVRSSVSRFLRYHPVNEFEPFFESIGLKPDEYLQFLPRNLMFLADDELLLENYYVLCKYGVERSRIGKIYKEATEVFGYEYGVLQLKLQGYQNLGLNQSFVAKVVASSPHLLIGNVCREFVEVLEKLKNVGIGYDWLEEHIREEDSYDWKCMLRLMRFLCELGLSDKQVGEVFTQHPDLLLESSGRVTFCLFGWLLKFGLTPSDVQAMFLQFPQISVSKFTYNLCNCYKFLDEINMAAEDIGSIVCSHPTLLGMCELKKITSLMSALNCGKSKLREMVECNPFMLTKWVLGTKVEPLQEEKRAVKVQLLKTQFLLSLGFKENSKDMEKALDVMRGNSAELQERFDSFVNIGFSRDEVIRMLKVAPQILNQFSDVIETKIEVLVKDLGYRLSDLLTYPRLVSYSIERLKLRLLMYKWLRDAEAVPPNLAISTLMSSTEKDFVRTYVNSHHQGPEFWKRLKKKFVPTHNR